MKLFRHQGIVCSVMRSNPDGSMTSYPLDHPDYLAWLAEGNTPLPPDPPSIEELNAPILSQLKAIDEKSIRALRDGDTDWIDAFRKQAKELREKLQKE